MCLKIYLRLYAVYSADYMQYSAELATKAKPLFTERTGGHAESSIANYIVKTIISILNVEVLTN